MARLLDMPLAFVAALVCLVPQDAPNPYSVAPSVAQSVRLALTPKLDGSLEPEEWQPFSEGTYLQWEPGRVHLAAELGTAQQLVATFDLRGDGWLIGRDNLEIRIRNENGSPQMTARLLDATGVAGPAWKELPGFLDASRVAAVLRGEVWTVEASIVDPGIFMLSYDPVKLLSARLDRFDAAAPDSPAYLPRSGAPISFGLFAEEGVPAGVDWKPEVAPGVVTPGEEIRMRYTWSFRETQPLLDRIELRSEGLVRSAAASLTRPFPDWDRKRRAFIDYSTKIKDDADLGYRILLGTAEPGAGAPYMMRHSYRIAPVVDFELVPVRGVSSKPDPQKLRLTVHVRSNSTRRVDGEWRAELPNGWTAGTEGDSKLQIFSPWGRIRKVAEVVVPAGAAGVYPLKFRATIGKRIVEQTAWIWISPAQ